MKYVRRVFLKKAGALGVLMITGTQVSARSLPKVLILGDSISIGYTPVVKELLKEKADVTRPAVNCQGTTLGVQKVDEWIGDVVWDLIHFNFGLHDLKHVDPVTRINSSKVEDPQQADLKQYKKNLEEIVKKLKVTKAKLIFATTTPYPDQPEGPYRKAEDVIEYNKIALKIMRKYKVPINDLYGFVLPDMERLLLPNNVHFKKDGNAVLGKKVADTIQSFLG
jgi:hypothetical protein